MGISAYVADQVFQWVYKHYVFDFQNMTNVSKKIRQILENKFSVISIHELDKEYSKDDHAVKYAFKLNNNHVIESVLLNDRGRYTICVSSQSGCALACRFCVTGLMGFKSNLKIDEIVSQILIIMSSGVTISNLVFMGMGEPLMNYDSLMGALHLIHSDYGCGIGKRRVVISTAGYLAGIRRLIKDNIHLNLAFSLGHPDATIRSDVMPVNERNPLGEVLETLKVYLSMHNRKLTIEYTLLDDVNTDDNALDGVAKIAKMLNSKVNLINFNPHPRLPYKPVTSKKLNYAKMKVSQQGVAVTVRYRRGDDVMAACGQLGSKLIKE